MGWFDEQIRERILTDNEQLSDALGAMASAVDGGRAAASAGESRKQQAAMGEILQYYHVKEKELPKGTNDLLDQLDYQLRPAGILHRRIHLTEGWQKDCVGPLLGFKKSGTMVALMPSRGGYSYRDYDTGDKVTVHGNGLTELSGEAVCFYRPLPNKKLSVGDLLRFIITGFSLSDFITLGIIALLATLVGMLTPKLNNLIFGSVIPAGSLSLLAPLTCLAIGITVSTLLMSVCRSAIQERITMRTDAEVQSAAMMRLLALPPEFFRQYSAGELMSRLNNISNLCSMLSDIILSTGFTGLFSLLYVGQIFKYAPTLVVPAVVVIALTLIVSVAATYVRVGNTTQRMEHSAKESGLIFSLLSGIQKIRLAGAEKRAFSQWAEEYAEDAKLQYDPSPAIKYSSVVITAVSQLGLLAIYFLAAKTSVSQTNYMTFNSAYALVSAAFTSLASAISTGAAIKPALTMVRPILEAVPEENESKKLVGRLHGAVELSHVTFRYREDGPAILNDLSLRIRPGQYVAIVGKTGCGKSTLIRMLLGFEKPQKGAVYYDGQDISQLDLPSLRRNIGTVLQDGKLFPGDILSNITISAPWLTLEDAWEAARMAGVDKDIREMPMGMQTLIADTAGISGGQAQRLMIARAIAPKPRILIFDEATSALDNITQKQVTESLDSLKCTRIVVAHRLSTIRSCSRIIVLDGGHIVQDGTYEELMAEKGGLFRELVERQQVNAPAPAAEQ